jgi:hypothetical protein
MTESSPVRYLHEDLLGGLLGVVVVPEDLEAEVVDAVLVGLEERPERLSAGTRPVRVEQPALLHLMDYSTGRRLAINRKTTGRTRKRGMGKDRSAPPVSLTPSDGLCLPEGSLPRGRDPM